MVRPFRRADALRVLAAADTARRAGARLIHALRARSSTIRPGNRWRLAARAGGQAYSHVRRDVLHPLGPDGVRPYAEFTGEAVIGPFVLVSRPAAEPRLAGRPRVAGPDGSRARLAHGRGVRQRPVQVRQRLLRADGAELGAGRARRASAQQLRLHAGRGGLRHRHARDAPAARRSRDRPRRTRRTSLGRTVHRYFFAHRLSARPERAARLALWETSRARRASTATSTAATGIRSASCCLANQYRAGRPTATSCSALDVALAGVRPRPRSRRSSRIDDSAVREHAAAPTAIPTAGRSPSRAFGPAGPRARRGGRSTPRPRAWPSAPSIRSRTSPMPASGSAGTSTTWTSSRSRSACRRGTRWLLTPELTLLRQGEGEINDPFPGHRRRRRAQIPQIFIGVVERTYRAALGLSGRAGPARPPRQRRAAPRRQRGAPGGPHREPLRGTAPGHAGPQPRGSAAMRQPPPPLTRDRVLQLIQRMKEQPGRGGGRHHARPLPHRRHRAALARGAGAGGDRARAPRGAGRRGQRGRQRRRRMGAQLPAGRRGGRRRRRRRHPAGAGGGAAGGPVRAHRSPAGRPPPRPASSPGRSRSSGSTTRSRPCSTAPTSTG